MMRSNMLGSTYKDLKHNTLLVVNMSSRVLGSTYKDLKRSQNNPFSSGNPC